MASATLPYTTRTIVSADGISVTYRQMGHGPGLVLLHGGMQAAQNFMKLATALSDAFTVYISTRRSRSLTPSAAAEYEMQKEVEDLDALLARTGARNVFGLSAGALVALEAALTLHSIEKIALYEPPLTIDGLPSPSTWAKPYEQEMARNDLAAAMVTCMRGTGDRVRFMETPRLVLVPLMRMAIRSSARDHNTEDLPLETLIRSVHFDLRLVAQMAGSIERFRAVAARALLIGGSRSAAYLAPALDALARVLPHAHRVELPGLGHLAPDNVDKPEHVAQAIRPFFLEDLTT